MATSDNRPRQEVPREANSFDDATQSSQGLDPLVMIQRLLRAEVDSKCTELRRATCLRRVRVHIDARRDFESDKAGSDDRRVELCFQQSTGDSALP
jgi:hypothetical protein